MKQLALIGDTLIHRLIYPAFINGFDQALMDKYGGWMKDMHAGSDGSPLDPEIRITAIVSKDPAAKEVAAVCGIPHIYTSASELDVDTLDGALVLEDDGTKHLAMAEPFLTRGKFVYIDKPVAASTADTARMIEMATQSGASFFGGSALRYSPKAKIIKDALSERRPQYLTISGPGHWLNYACHNVELLDYIHGVKGAHVVAAGSEERGAVLVSCSDGLICSIHFGAGHPPMFRVNAQFEDGSVEWFIDDAIGYYRGLANEMVRMIRTGNAGDSATHMLDVTSVLEQGLLLLS